jgi:predicted DNA-binding protein
MLIREEKMNFNIYINDELSHKLTYISESTHKKRNTVIREALELYISQLEKPTWPSSILEFKGVKDFSPFEDLRKELPEDSRNTFLEER